MRGVGTYKFVYIVYTLSLIVSETAALCIFAVGVKQGVWQMNIHLRIIAARVLNNFGVKGMYREESAGTERELYR